MTNPQTNAPLVAPSAEFLPDGVTKIVYPKETPPVIIPVPPTDDKVKK